MNKIVFSDLDGTILDHYTYSWKESEPGIKLLKKNNIPLILVSSKTESEMIPILKSFDLKTPFIFENGAGISFFDSNKKVFFTELTGFSLIELKSKIKILKDKFNIKFKTILEMSIKDIIDFTGLSENNASLSRERKGSLPFIIEENIIDNLDSINNFLEKDNLMISKGGRFFHFLSKNSNKGTAMFKVIKHYKDNGFKPLSIAIGDSENDIPLLISADKGFLVKKNDGFHVDLNFQGLIKTDGIGPAGFTEAIKNII